MGPKSESLNSLLYASTAVLPFDVASLAQLELIAAERNREHRITGYLAYRGGRFMQYLEGPDHEVAMLLDNIRNDPRHTITVELPLPEAPRRFPTWSMQLLDPLWFPTGSPLDTIAELLGQRPMLTADKDVVRPAINRLLDELALSA